MSQDDTSVGGTAQQPAGNAAAAGVSRSQGNTEPSELPQRFGDALTDAGPAPIDVQREALRCLVKIAPQPATRSWLADRMDCSPSTVGRAVRGLERDGLAADRELLGGTQVHPISLVDPDVDPEPTLSDRSATRPEIIESKLSEVLSKERARAALEQAGAVYAFMFIGLAVVTEIAWPLTAHVSWSGNIFGGGAVLMGLSVAVVRAIGGLNRRLG